jgi:hypothetical protein
MGTTMIGLDERTNVTPVPIELDGNTDHQAQPRDGRPSWPALVAAVILTALLTGAAGAAAANRATAVQPPAPVTRTVELRLFGDGVGQTARVWTPDAAQDVQPWGWRGTYVDPRAAIYVVQAGANGSAECTIEVDGREVAHQTAGPLESATCWWIA